MPKDKVTERIERDVDRNVERVRVQADVGTAERQDIQSETTREREEAPETKG